jgi:hypothetical protein
MFSIIALAAILLGDSVPPADVANGGLLCYYERRGQRRSFFSPRPFTTLRTAVRPTTNETYRQPDSSGEDSSGTFS